MASFGLTSLSICNGYFSLSKCATILFIVYISQSLALQRFKLHDDDGQALAQVLQKWTAAA